MANQVRLKLNQAAIRKLLQSAEVQQDLRRRTGHVKAAAGPGFEARVQVAQGSSKLGRAMGYVTTATPEARRRQAKSPVLQRALLSGK